MPKKEEQAPSKETEQLAQRHRNLYFFDDPIQRDRVTEELVSYILKRLEKKRKADVSFIHKLLLNPYLSPKTRIEQFIKEGWFFNQKKYKNIETPTSTLQFIIYHACSDPRILTFLQQHILPEKFSLDKSFHPFNNNLKELHIFTEQLLTSTSTVKEFGINDNSIYIISPKSLNPLTAWYTHHSYLDLDRTIIHLLDKNAGQLKIHQLAILGYLYGFLDSNHPEGAKNRTILNWYLNGQLPGIIKDLIQNKESRPIASGRVEKLKQFWHTAFVQKWAASALIGYENVSLLTQPDRTIAQKKLFLDTRTATSKSSIAIQADKQAARIGNTPQNQNLLHSTKIAALAEFEHITHKLLQQEKSARKNLHAFTLAMVQEYNPQVQHIFDYRNQPIGEWSILKQKNGLIFETFIKTAAKLSRNNIQKFEQQKIIADTANALISVTENSRSTSKLSLTSLFGLEFYSISPLEQCCLIIFSCLSMASSKNKPDQTVYLISHKLQQLLKRHTDFEQHSSVQENQEITLTDWRFPIVNSEQKIQFAQQRLVSLQRKDEIISTQNKDLIEYANTQYKIIEKLSELKIILTEKKVDKLNGVVVTALYFLIIIGLSFGISYLLSDGKIGVKGFSKGIILTPLFFAGIYTLSIFNKLQKEYYQKELLTDTRLTLFDKELQSKLPQIQKILGISIKKTRKLIGLLTALMIITPIFLEIGKTVAHAVENKSFSFSSFSDSDKTDSQEPPTIPDQISLESLQHSKHKLQGTIYHLPEDFSGFYGEPIGNQPHGWYYPDGKKFIDQSPQLFDNIEFTKSIDSYTHEPQPDEFVYEPELQADTTIIYPIEGYEIIKIYQVDGAEPILGVSGNLYYRAENTPTRILLVTRKLPQEILSNRGDVRKIESVAGVTYQPWLNWDTTYQQALELNAQLTTDTALQTVHNSMILRLNNLVQEYKTGSVSEAEMPEAFSKIITHYSIAYGDYVNSQRTYSLQYQNPNLDGAFSTLRGIAMQPNSGYYCTVANVSFQEFMASVNVQVLTKSVAPVSNYDGELISRIDHLNSAVLLPNGEVLYTDMTPTHPNPGEDLSVLEKIPPQEATPLPLESVAQVGGALVVASRAYVAGKKIKERRKFAFEYKIDAALPKNTEFATNTLKAVQHILLYVSEVVDPEKTEQLLKNSFHTSREALLTSIASDALAVISTEPVKKTVDITVAKIDESLKQSLLGYAKKLKQSKKETQQKSANSENQSTHKEQKKNNQLSILSSINTETRTVISADLTFVWQAIKKQKKELLAKLNAENTLLRAEFKIGKTQNQSGVSTHSQLAQLENLEKLIKTNQHKIIQIEQSVRSLRSILDLLIKAGR